MAQALVRLVVDCSLVVKWKITTEDYAAEAEEVLLDWQRRSIEACAPNLLQAEVMSAFLRAHRRGRVSRTEAEGAIRDLMALPFVTSDLAPILVRAFEIGLSRNCRDRPQGIVGCGRGSGEMMAAQVRCGRRSGHLYSSAAALA